MSDNYSCYEEYCDAMEGQAQSDMEAEALASEGEAAAQMANIEAGTDQEELKEYADTIKEEDMNSLDRKRRRFFALAHELGFEAETVKERAKKHFMKDHFNDLTEDQLEELIAKLESKKLLKN